MQSSRIGITVMSVNVGRCNIFVTHSLIHEGSHREVFWNFLVQPSLTFSDGVAKDSLDGRFRSASSSKHPAEDVELGWTRKSR